MLLKGVIKGSPYIGVYAEANESIAIVPKDAEKNSINDIERALGVEVYTTFIGGSPLIGSLLILNSHGAILPDFSDIEDVQFLKNDYNILFLEDKLNAVGNDILANDKVALIHEGFSDETAKLISDVMDVEVVKGKIGGIPTVGSVAVITKKALLVNPQVDDDELKYLSSLFGVPAYVVTANFGSIFIGASLIANSKGAYIGQNSTVVEISRIEEYLNI
ncbi:MAG: translation initiation factor IF-6 [Thermoplasmata archaeon]